MVNRENYQEILGCKKSIKPQYLWKVPYGKFISKVRDFKNKTIVDFGCSVKSPAYKQFLAQNGEMSKGYHGYDVSVGAVRWLKVEGFFLNFWSLRKNSFDAINASQVYEHLDELERERFLAKSYQVLKPGGYLYLDFPYISNLNIIEFFRRDRTHKPVSCEDEALYLRQFGFKTELYVGGYSMPYLGLIENLRWFIINLTFGFKPFWVTFIKAQKYVK